MSASLTVVISLEPGIDDHDSIGLADDDRTLVDEILGELREQLLTLPDITSVHETRHQPPQHRGTLSDPASGLITALSVMSLSTPVGIAAIVSLINHHQKRLRERRFVLELTETDGTRTTRIETDGMGPAAIENAVRRAVNATQPTEQPTDKPRGEKNGKHHHRARRR